MSHRSSSSFPFLASLALHASALIALVVFAEKEDRDRPLFEMGFTIEPLRAKNPAEAPPAVSPPVSRTTFSPAVSQASTPDGPAPSRRSENASPSASGALAKFAPLSASTKEFSGYFLRVRTQVQSHLLYPPDLRSQRIHGVVGLLLVINSSGALNSVEISRPSGSQALDQSALESVKKAAPFEAFSGEPRTVRIPIEFSLLQPAR